MLKIELLFKYRYEYFLQLWRSQKTKFHGLIGLDVKHKMYVWRKQCIADHLASCIPTEKHSGASMTLCGCLSAKKGLRGRMERNMKHLQMKTILLRCIFLRHNEFVLYLYKKFEEMWRGLNAFWMRCMFAYVMALLNTYYRCSPTRYMFFLNQG